MVWHHILYLGESAEHVQCSVYSAKNDDKQLNILENMQFHLFS